MPGLDTPMSISSRLIAPLALGFALAACEKPEPLPEPLTVQPEVLALRAEISADLARAKCIEREIPKAIAALRERYDRPPIDANAVRKMTDAQRRIFLDSERKLLKDEQIDRQNLRGRVAAYCRAENNKTTPHL